MTTKSTQIEGKIKDIHKKIFPDSDDELIKILKLNTVDELNTKISDKLNEDVNYLQKEFFH